MRARLATGQGIGWEYDAVNEIAKRLNAKVNWNTMSWDTMIQAVHDGQYDIGMDGISITDDRKKQVDFSDPYMDNKEYMLVRAAEDRIKQPGDLLTNTDLLIGAQSGTSGFYAAEGLLNPDLKDGDKPDDSRIKLFDTFGAQRLIWGSDWPVLRLAGDYAGWLSQARSAIPEAAHAAVFDSNVRRIYRL